jgi:hypothetical protein
VVLVEVEEEAVEQMKLLASAALEQFWAARAVLTNRNTSKTEGTDCQALPATTPTHLEASVAFLEIFLAQLSDVLVLRRALQVLQHVELALEWSVSCEHPLLILLQGMSRRI